MLQCREHTQFSAVHKGRLNLWRDSLDKFCTLLAPALEQCTAREWVVRLIQFVMIFTIIFDEEGGVRTSL